MRRFCSVFFSHSLTITMLLLLCLPSYAQTESIVLSDPVLDHFPLVRVNANVPCSRFSETSNGAELQLQEDANSVLISETITRSINTQTALLFDIWNGAIDRISPIRGSLIGALRSEPNKPALLASTDELLMLGPDPTGLHIMSVVSETGWTNNGGLIVNNIDRVIPAKSVTALTTLISETLNTFTSLEQRPDLVKSIVVFSDGTDPVVASRQQTEAVLAAAQQQGVTIHTVFMADAFQDETYLRQFSDHTGGIAQTLTLTSTESALDPLWQSISKVGCEILYRSKQKQPKLLTVWSQQTSTQANTSQLPLPSLDLPAPALDSLELLPSSQISLAQTSIVTLTYRTAFEKYSDRQIQRVEYGIEDRIERSTTHSETSSSLIIPVQGLPPGNYTIYLRVYDELGLSAERKHTLEVIAPPGVLQPETPPLITARGDVPTEPSQVAEPSWLERAARWIEARYTEITGWDWRLLLISLLVITLLIVEIIALWLWIRNRMKRWKREKVRGDFSSGQSLIAEQPVIAVLRRRKLHNDVPEVIPLRKVYTLIGRNTGKLDITLNEPEIGSDVFAIRQQGEEFIIASEPDTNSVMVQNKSLKELGETRLDSDYLIRIGQVEFIFYIIRPLMQRRNGATDSVAEG